MINDNGGTGSDQGEQDENEDVLASGNGHGQRIISYNLNEGERPGGLKIRFKVRLLGGKPARALDARQAEAIREFLKWASQQEQPQSPPSTGGRPPEPTTPSP
jgi:hypothetical protein